MHGSFECLPSATCRIVCLVLMCALGCGGDEPGRRATVDGASASTASESESGLAGVVREQLARYPEMELEDLYKLMHQAALGGAHAVRDSAAARQRLDEEIRALLGQPAAGFPRRDDEPLTERITPGGDLVRLNLRPYLARGGDIESLWRAFIRTATERTGSLDTLRTWWSEAEALAADGQLPFPPEALRSFFVRQGVRGFPTPRHSSHYVQLYRPAYRVIESERLPPDAPR